MNGLQKAMLALGAELEKVGAGDGIVVLSLNFAAYVIVIGQLELTGAREFETLSFAGIRLECKT